MKRALAILLLVAGCKSAQPPAPRPSSAAAPPPAQEGTIPAELRERVSRASSIGKQLFVLDKVAAIGTDVLLANVPDVQKRSIGGYIPMQMADERGSPTDAFLVSFFTTDDRPRIAYEVRIAADVAPEFEAFDPPKHGDEALSMLVRARRVAIAAMPKLGQPVNPVLLPASDGETGVVVYLLAGTKQPNIAVLGKHFRAVVAMGASSVTSMQPLTNGVLELPTRDANGKRPEALVTTHVVTDYPLETHVFTSLLHELPIFVATQRGLWSVDGTKITFLGDKKLEQSAN